MLGDKNIMAFVGSTDQDRASKFYVDTLGLRLTSRDNFALVIDANGIMLRVTRVEKVIPASYTVLGWNVSDIRTTMAGLTKRGIIFDRIPYIQQDTEGIWTAPDGTMVAWFKDPDANILSLTQFRA
ncbi:MAG: VOC family protein [Bacteroidota bacterium]